MSFIHVTRYGGVKTLLLAVSAIAYIDECEGGTAIRLIGGESLRVNEDPQTIRTRASGEEPSSVPPPEEAPKPAHKGGKRK